MPSDDAPPYPPSGLNRISYRRYLSPVGEHHERPARCGDAVTLGEPERGPVGEGTLISLITVKVSKAVSDIRQTVFAAG
jgi:hypothetical protein